MRGRKLCQRWYKNNEGLPVRGPVDLAGEDFKCQPTHHEANGVQYIQNHKTNGVQPNPPQLQRRFSARRFQRGY